MPRPPAPEVKPVTRSGPPGALIGGVVVLVVALIAGLVWAVTRGSDLEAEGSTSTLADGGGLSVGPGPEADVPQVHVYEDFQCPWCGVLENSIGEGLASKAEAGEINVTYTIMSFLDGNLRNDASTRATNAALCADDQGVFPAFHSQVYAHQPATEGDGWTDEQLRGFAESAGLSGTQLETFGSCMDDRTHADYVNAMQERAGRDGVTGTPRLFVDGEAVSDADMQRLMSEPAYLDEVITTMSGS